MGYLMFGHNIRRRLLFVLMGALVFFGVYSIGAAVEMTPQEAQEVRDAFDEQIQDINDVGIFFNNIRIALGMFVPGAGVALGVFSAYATGNVFAAIAEDSPALQGVPPQLILITPFGIMEVFSYGVAMSRSALLVYYFVKRRPWREYAMPTLVEIGMVAAVLISAAVIEWWMIQEFGGTELELEGV
jgi:uncharacterized membrane protein SpoIIM required for sporulation